jgi:hypothetical protein
MDYQTAILTTLKTLPLPTKTKTSVPLPILYSYYQKKAWTISNHLPRYPPDPIYGHSECGSDCSANIPMASVEEGQLQAPVINDWDDTRSMSSHRSEDEINHSSLHWTACHNSECIYHSEDNTYRNALKVLEIPQPIMRPPQSPTHLCLNPQDSQAKDLAGPDSTSNS